MNFLISINRPEIFEKLKNQLNDKSEYYPLYVYDNGELGEDQYYPECQIAGRLRNLL